MQNLWTKCKRQKRLDGEQLYHSECQRRLGLCSLIAIDSVLSLSTILFTILPNVFAVTGLHSPPLASAVIAAILHYLTASQLSSISRKTPKNGLLYTFSYVLGSEALAFLIAWSQLFDGFSLLVILTQTLSDHINILFNSNLTIHFDFKIADLIFLRVDALALIFIGVSAAIMCCSLRVLTTISIVFLVACLFTSTSTTVVALLHNIAHLKINYIDFPYGFDEVFNGACWLMISILCLELVTFTPEETEHPRKILPLVFPALSKTTIILIFLTVLAFFPFGYRLAYTHDSLLPLAFNTIGIFSARYLMTVGSVCGLTASVLASFLFGSRLLCALANDKLIPSFISTTYGKGGSCRLAIILTAFFVSILSIIPRLTLCRLLPLNICLRLACQAFFVFKSCFIPEQNELNHVPSYDNIFASNRTSLVDRRSVDDYSLGLSACSSSDDEEDDLIMEKLWKVNGNEFCENECESSFSQVDESLVENGTASQSRKSTAEMEKDTAAGVPLIVSKLDAHNCFIASCADSQNDAMKLQKWPRFHIYESDCTEPPSAVLRKHSNACDSDTDKERKKAIRYAIYFMFLSTLISVSHKIIRQTKEYLPILPVITLIVSFLLGIWIFFSIYHTRRNSSDVDKQRFLPLQCLLSTFLLFQFLINFPLINYAFEIGWLLIGFIFYVLFSLRRH